jgi:hypothetical protein
MREPARDAHDFVRVTMDQRLGDGSWATSDEIAVVSSPRLVMRLLRDMDGYDSWWPGLNVALSAPNTVAGVGAEGRMSIGPWRCPRWRFRVTEIRDPDFIQLDLRGDLVGRAAWEIEPYGALTAVRFAWYGVRPMGWVARLLVRKWEVRWHHLLVRGGLLGLKTRVERGDH